MDDMGVPTTSESRGYVPRTDGGAKAGGPLSASHAALKNQWAFWDIFSPP